MVELALDHTGAHALDELGLGEWKSFSYVPLEETSVLALDLPPTFRHVFGLLYAIKRGSERSERVLRVVNAATKLNSSNPTVWMLRREVVLAMSASDEGVWARELGYVGSIILHNPKNYQAWEHRRLVSLRGNALVTEAEFVDAVLSGDAKNYHAWSHRAWLVRDCEMTEGEMAAMEWFLRQDCRNNSAWNHRWLVAGATNSRNDEEMKFALEVVDDAPRNESVWNYVHALGREGVDLKRAKDKARECLEVDAGCVAARRFLILNAQKHEAKDVTLHCQLLATGVDPVRRKYWQAQYIAAKALLEEQ